MDNERSEEASLASPATPRRSLILTPRIQVTWRLCNPVGSLVPASVTKTPHKGKKWEERKRLVCPWDTRQREIETSKSPQVQQTKGLFTLRLPGSVDLLRCACGIGNAFFFCKGETGEHRKTSGGVFARWNLAVMTLVWKGLNGVRKQRLVSQLQTQKDKDSSIKPKERECKGEKWKIVFTWPLPKDRKQTNVFQLQSATNCRNLLFTLFLLQSRKRRNQGTAWSVKLHSLCSPLTRHKAQSCSRNNSTRKIIPLQCLE